MKCPSCENPLTSKNVSGMILFACDGGCGGVWLNHFEMKKFEDPQQPDVETLLKLKINPSAKKDNNGPRKCPKCETFTMMKHFADAKQVVTIDECPKCAGIWLDAGELHEIHGEYKTEAERIQAAEKIFNDMFGPEMAEIHKHDEEQNAKFLRFSHALRFICPSYYLKG